MKNKINYSEIVNKLSTVQEQMTWIAKHIEELAPSLEKNATSKFLFVDIIDENCSDQIHAEMSENNEFNKNIVIPSFIEDLNYAQDQEDPDDKYYSTLIIYYFIGVFYTHYGMQTEEGQAFEHPFAAIVFNKSDFRDVMAYSAISLPEYCDCSSDTLYTIEPKDRPTNFAASADMLRAEGIVNASYKNISEHSELADYLNTATPKSAFIIENSNPDPIKMYTNLFSKVTELTDIGLEFSEIDVDNSGFFINYQITLGELKKEFTVQLLDSYAHMVIDHINELLNTVSDKEICAFFIDESKCCFAYLPNKLILKLEDLNVLRRGESGLH